MLAVLVERARESGLIKHLVQNLLEEGLVMLQYADDTIFMFQDDLDSARNLKNLLCIFEHLSGLKINFLKSEVFCCGNAKDMGNVYTSIFTCVEGVLPFRYLGIPMHNKRVRLSDWKPSESKVEKKVGEWIGKYTSYGDRLILLTSCLTNVLFYMLSFFPLPKGTCKRFDFFRKRFFLARIR